MEGLIFTLIGRDTPGIVDMVAACVAHHGGSWEESQLIRLHGQFTGLVHAHVPSDRREALRAALADLPGIQTIVADALDDAERLETIHLELIGADRPGIVQQIAHVLAQRDVNLEQMTTSTERAPMSGEPMFRVRAVLRAPEDQSLAELRTRLEALANELMVEVTLGDQPR